LENIPEIRRIKKTEENKMPDFIEKIPSEIEDQEMEVVVYKISNYPADYTLQGLYDKEKGQEIIIPPFQRGFVWTLSQASKLIESFLLGLPVPSIFLYKEKDSQKLLVIDGQQRLKTIFGYFSNSFPDTKKTFYLKDVNAKWKDKSFSDLDEADKRRLKDAVLRAIIVEQLDPEDNTSIFHIFQRLNTGGTILRPQEIRNCIYQGDFNNLLRILNENAAWRGIIGVPKPDKRMRDIELILRFLALRYEYKNYKKPMKDFLSNFMSKYGNEKGKIEEFREVFEKTVDAIHNKLNCNPFKIKAGLNAAVFDSIMVAFALNLDRIPSNIKSRHQQLIDDNLYKDCIYKFTTDEKVVKQRISLAIEKIFK